jgi:integrase
MADAIIKSSEKQSTLTQTRYRDQLLLRLLILVGCRRRGLVRLGWRR